MMTPVAQLDRARILEALSRVYDPEIGAPITALGLVDSVEADEDGSVEVSVHPVSPFSPITFIAKLALDVARALRSLEGARAVKITLTSHPLSDYLNRSLDKLLGLEEKTR